METTDFYRPGQARAFTLSIKIKIKTVYKKAKHVGLNINQILYTERWQSKGRKFIIFNIKKILIEIIEKSFFLIFIKLY